jgi:hypothetical protein
MHYLLSFRITLNRRYLDATFVIRTACLGLSELLPMPSKVQTTHPAALGSDIAHILPRCMLTLVSKSTFQVGMSSFSSVFSDVKTELSDTYLNSIIPANGCMPRSLALGPSPVVGRIFKGTVAKTLSLIHLT